MSLRNEAVLAAAPAAISLHSAPGPQALPPPSLWLRGGSLRARACVGPNSLRWPIILRTLFLGHTRLGFFQFRDTACLQCFSCVRARVSRTMRVRPSTSSEATDEGTAGRTTRDTGGSTGGHHGRSRQAGCHARTITITRQSTAPARETRGWASKVWYRVSDLGGETPGPVAR